MQLVGYAKRAYMQKSKKESKKDLGIIKLFKKETFVWTVLLTSNRAI